MFELLLGLPGYIIGEFRNLYEMSPTLFWIIIISFTVTIYGIRTIRKREANKSDRND